MFNDHIQKNDHLALSCFAIRKSIYQSTSEYIHRSAEVKYKLLAVKDLVKFNGKNPTNNELEELAHGTHFAIYSAE